MAKVRHLAKAPIIEALLDIRVQPREGFAVESLLEVGARVKAKYGQRQEKAQGQFQFNLDATVEAGKAKLTSTTLGYVYKSVDDHRLLQIARDGFTQNFLPPYSDGDTLISEAMENWRHYAEISNPARITRLALRYINRLHFPPDSIDFDEYLTASPQIPKDIPQVVSNFFSKVVIVNEEIGAFAGVSQIFTGEYDEKGTDVTLDIDVYSGVSLDKDDVAIWEKIAQLRKFKNDIFFGFVKDKLLEGYE